LPPLPQKAEAPKPDAPKPDTPAQGAQPEQK
jgi:hypothetical protein